MEINFLGYRIRINRFKGRREFSLGDAQEINEDHVAQLKKLSREELEARRDEVTVNNIDEEKGLEKAKTILAEYGIVIVPDFMDPGKAQELAHTLHAAYQKKVSRLNDDHYEDEDVLVQKGGVKVRGYKDLADHAKSIMMLRQGQDEGMVDIFNADRLISNLAEEVRAPFEREVILSLLQGKGNELKAQNLNCYINQGITKTRGFHVDSYSEQLKGFIYLTDVDSLDDGPYTYVKGSHVETPYRRANQKLSEGLPNQTEAPLIDQSAVVPVIAPRGSLVISDQGGFHRGFPQAADAYRMIAVMNYK